MTLSDVKRLVGEMDALERELRSYPLESQNAALTMKKFHELEARAGAFAIAYCRAALSAEPGVEMSPLYFMRDNHTFLRLDEHDINVSLEKLSKEFDDKYSHGMLCTKRKIGPQEPIHSQGPSKRDDFLLAAQDWLQQHATARSNYAAETAHPPAPAGVTVTDEMVERMAKWLCTNENHDPTDTITEYVNGIDESWPLWREYENAARAALVAALKGEGT